MNHHQTHFSPGKGMSSSPLCQLSYSPSAYSTIRFPKFIVGPGRHAIKPITYFKTKNKTGVTEMKKKQPTL
jgi:hypothetical protein